MLACLLSFQVAAATPNRAEGACALTWTGLMTSTKSGSYGIVSWSGSITYKLEMNTCNLGVYTRIYVDKFTSRFYVDGQRTFYYQTPFAGLLKNCNTFTNGCLIDQGDAIYVDTRAFHRTGPGYVPASSTRTAYPHLTYTYSTYTAFMDSVCDAGCIEPLVLVIWQFRRGVAYVDSGVFNFY
jgi:hypothetical protein